ncbi:unnamed protein product [Pedinophyceae sp. YPF-701]|nr:unnamed protein product [Pedinophyceae sp. YPF-701]
MQHQTSINPTPGHQAPSPTARAGLARSQTTPAPIKQDNTVYISNLEYYCTTELISQFLEECAGDDSVNQVQLITRGGSARSGSAGLALAEMKDPDTARRVIQELNGQSFMGREVKLSTDKFMG